MPVTIVVARKSPLPFLDFSTGVQKVTDVGTLFLLQLRASSWLARDVEARET